MNLINTSTKGLSAALAIGLLSATGAAASTVDASVTSITAAWLNPNPAGITIDNSGTTETARWGNPASSGGQSGYDFTPAAVPISPIAVDSTFGLGTFVHQNFPIFDDRTVPGTIDLQLDIVGALLDGDDTPFSVTSIFTFTHTETPNGESPCAEGGSNPCPDLVEVSLNSGASTSVSIGGVEYFFSVSGFVVGGVPVTSFLTLEEQSNSATLVGTFTADVNVVPLPAAAWMLLAGVGGLAAVSRRKKRVDV